MSRHNQDRRRQRANTKPRCDYCTQPRAKRIFIRDRDAGTVSLVASLCEQHYTELTNLDPWLAERFRHAG